MTKGFDTQRALAKTEFAEGSEAAMTKSRSKEQSVARRDSGVYVKGERGEIAQRALDKLDPEERMIFAKEYDLAQEKLLQAQERALFNQAKIEELNKKIEQANKQLAIFKEELTPDRQREWQTTQAQLVEHFKKKNPGQPEPDSIQELIQTIRAERSDFAGRLLVRKYEEATETNRRIGEQDAVLNRTQKELTQIRNRLNQSKLDEAGFAVSLASTVEALEAAAKKAEQHREETGTPLSVEDIIDIEESAPTQPAENDIEQLRPEDIVDVEDERPAKAA